MTTANSMADHLAVATASTIRVLLVDDQPMVGEAVRRVLLHEADAEFHYCADPRQALAVARDFRPTVILQDLIMPNVSGLDLVRQYRADPATAGAPIVVLSSREEPLVKSEAFKLGANDYLVKLPDPIELVARIRYHSMAYQAQIQRDEAYRALRDSQRRLMAAGIALAENEASYRLLADTATDIISRSDLEGTMLYLSPAVERVTGYAAPELVGRNIADLLHPDDAGPYFARYARMIKGDQADGKPVEYRIRHKDGRWICIEGNPTLVRGDDGRALGFVDVSRDDTLRKTLETELRVARQEAEAAAAVKGEFLANMSHELRTPLTSVLGFTRLAMDQPDLTEASRTYIRKASNAGAALLATVNDILDFSKLESGQLEIRPEPSDAAEVCRETLELFSEASAAKGVALRFTTSDLPPSLSLDPNRLRQLLLNLVGNAVKFSDDGEIVLAAAWRAADQRLTVSVKDQGPGISPDQQTLLFQRFSQVGSSDTRRHGGTGLGLAICMGLVEAMGGRIGVESELGKGARFFFEIPASPSVASNVEDRPVIPMVRSEARVLVADDHAMNRELVRAVLDPVVGEVREVTNGLDAVAAASHTRFDLILMDLRMPELDGLGAMRAIREGGGPNANVPILAFSAGIDASSAAARLQAGFTGDLPKPLMPADLIAAVSLHTAGRGPKDVGAHRAA
ncbi:response regulator [Phenylobacterium sp. LjRoot225]|uniref:response regulator n=1 Tax=Phenylobacterium sp. LjRoot225 TaxID=3342285 RepID=UPI003ED078F1